MLHMATAAIPLPSSYHFPSTSPASYNRRYSQASYSSLARSAVWMNGKRNSLDGPDDATPTSAPNTIATATTTNRTALSPQDAPSVAAVESATAPPQESHTVTGTMSVPSVANGAVAVARRATDMKPPRRVADASGVGPALSDTPDTTAPSSPRMFVPTGAATPMPALADGRLSPPLRQTSAGSTPRIRPTTLDIPGLTKSKVSPDGKIAQRDVGSKLIIVMVGLPARGKSYITKKLARYLNWLQHDTEIFNVGERRRVAAGSHGHLDTSHPAPSARQEPERIAAEALLNGPPTPTSERSQPGIPSLNLPDAASRPASASSKNNLADMPPSPMPSPVPDTAINDTLHALDTAGNDSQEAMDQSANFFDPSNVKAAALREKAAADTLDDLLDYIMNGGGSVGIFDATNSTIQRRKWVMERIRARAGPDINVLFLESVCKNQAILESNMRLKLSGPDYKNMDPHQALADFKERVAIYEKNYVELGDYEEANNMPYVKVIDVGRKIISHQINGFLSQQAVSYLQIFNLAPRQIWITRHGQSVDNMLGRIGGDADLTDNGRRYAESLEKFIDSERKVWEVKQRDKAAHTHFPPHPGDHTPPNPYYSPDLAHSSAGFGAVEGGDIAAGVGGGRDDSYYPPPKNFCVWTSMLKRSIQSAEPFERQDDAFEVKQMRMLNELYSGAMEGLTYEEILSKYAGEFELRQRDKMQYRYPGPGGEGYLDVINRLKPVIVELERMTDHCLLLTHRSVARVLLAYFMGLKRDDTANLDCPLGMLYMLEPKPYGVDFKAYKYNAETAWFDEQPDFKLQRSKEAKYVE